MARVWPTVARLCLMTMKLFNITFMEKVYGSPVRQDGLYKIGRNKWELIYGFGKDAPDDEYGWNWRERFTRRPSPEKIREVIKETINRETDRRILEDFVWKRMPVWLSSENQFNYKAAYDLAVQTDGATLPVRFKFGTDASPVYYTFETLGDFTDFYTAAMLHINTALTAGWSEKDTLASLPFPEIV